MEIRETGRRHLASVRRRARPGASWEMWDPAGFTYQRGAAIVVNTKHNYPKCHNRKKDCVVFMEFKLRFIDETGNRVGWRFMR